MTGFAASDHKAPAHSIANNLTAKQQQEKSDVRDEISGVGSMVWGCESAHVIVHSIGRGEKMSANFEIQSTTLCMRVPVPGVCSCLR